MWSSSRWRQTNGSGFVLHGLFERRTRLDGHINEQYMHASTENASDRERLWALIKDIKLGTWLAGSVNAFDVCIVTIDEQGTGSWAMFLWNSRADAPVASTIVDGGPPESR